MPTAEELRARGNALFSQKEYPLAVAKYTEAIDLDAKNAILYSNRAACYLNLEQFMDASSDATKATELDPSYTKAWVRRATAFEGLGVRNASIDSWKKAIETLPKDDATSAAQLKAYKSKLRAAEQLRDSVQNKTKERPIYKANSVQSPWIMAEKLLNSAHGRTLTLSSAMVILEAYKHFSQGADFITQLQIQVRPNRRGPPQTIGNTNGVTCLVEGILMDERVFHIVAEKNWFAKYDDQLKFEVLALGIQEYLDHGPEQLIETAKEIQRQSGWDKVRPLLSELVRLWFIKGFLTNGLAGEARAAHGFYKSMIEVLTWGRSAWRDVSYENKGNLFRPTFLWKVRALDLELYITMISKHRSQDDPACIQLLEEMYQEAGDLLKDLGVNPMSPVGSEVTYISYYLNSKAQALSVQGFYHKHIAGIEKNGEVAREHLHKAALKYKESAMTYVQDDERRPYLLIIALDCLWKSGKGTYRETTTLMAEFRTSYQEMLRIWLNSATPLAKKEQLAQIVKIEGEALSKLSSGTVTLDSVHYRRQGFQS